MLVADVEVAQRPVDEWVGEAAQQLVCWLLGQQDQGWVSLALALMPMTDRLEAPRLVVPRAHNARLRAAGLASVYWRMCPLVAGWSRAVCDAKFDSPPLILWQSPTAVFADECTNAGLHGPSITPERTARVIAIASALAAEHGARFVGVRVWALSRPRQSLLVTPNGAAQLLVDTPWWPDHMGAVQ